MTFWPCRTSSGESQSSISLKAHKNIQYSWHMSTSWCVFVSYFLLPFVAEFAGVALQWRLCVRSAPARSRQIQEHDSDEWCGTLGWKVIRYHDVRVRYRILSYYVMQLIFMYIIPVHTHVTDTCIPLLSGIRKWSIIVFKYLKCISALIETCNMHMYM